MEKPANKKRKDIPSQKNKRLLALISTFLVVSILCTICVVVLYQESRSNEGEGKRIDEDGIINDTISSPGVNQAVSLEINRIHKKGIEDVMRKVGNSWKEKPIYHFVAVIDNAEWSSKNIDKWDTGYVGWEAFRFVEDEQDECIIELKIFETKKKLFRNYDQEMEVFQITYDFRNGRWTGDDGFNDSDGYGHFNGENYEIWFDVHQLDEDGDGIPYWWEVNKLHTDPKIDDSKLDPDEDDITTAWEWKWGYDPFVYDNHSTIDVEKDGLSNLEEYNLKKWLADPYHQDIYIEVDFMEKGPGLLAHEHVFWEESQLMLIDRFSEHDITVHIDDGWPGGPSNGGGEYLRYIEQYISPTSGIGSEFYKFHFADERKGAFRYVFIHHSGGWCFAQDYKLWNDVISIPSNFKFYAKVFFPPTITPRLQRVAMAVGVMHELGHSLNLNPPYHEGIDNASQVGRNNLPPMEKLKAKKEAIAYWDSYESCMNYNKFGQCILGYSDGSHGEHDADDWNQIDLTYFQRTSEEKYGLGWQTSPDKS